MRKTRGLPPLRESDEGWQILLRGLARFQEASRKAGFNPDQPRAPAGNSEGGRDSADQAGIVKRACARRASFYRGIGTFAVFGRGWLARNARMEAIGVRMCLEAAGVIDIAGAIRKEAAGAQAKAKRSKQGAAASGGGAAAGGGSLTQADPAAWDWTVWLALGLTAAAAVALTLALLWTWKKHGARATAYAQALGDRLETDFAALLAKVKGGTQR